MRFRLRCALLLGTLLLITALVFILLVIVTQQHKRNLSLAPPNVFDQQNYGANSAAADNHLPTIEDFEIRTLLSASDDDTTASNQKAQQLGDASAEMTPALMSMFPVGRFPPALRANASGTAVTLNVAIVLIVSLLSIAILVTAICCVIIVALALDTSSTAHHWSAQPLSPSARSSEFLLSSWPAMASQYHRLSQSPVYRTPGLAKFFKQQQQQRRQAQNHLLLLDILNDAPMDMPTLMDDED